MADATNPIPSPQPGDSEDVELALETSQRLFQKGDHAEALKWLRRAASSAEEAGDDLRQLQLARIAADLASNVSADQPVVTSAPSVMPAAASKASARLPQPPSKQPPPAPSGRGSVAPGPSTPPAKSSASAAPSGTPQPPVASGGPPPLAAKSKPAPAAASASVRTQPESQAPPSRVNDSQPPPAQPTQAAPKAAALSIKPKPTDPTPSASTLAAKPIASSTPSMAPAKPDKPIAAVPSGFVDMNAAHGAVRVSVRISARDESLYIVRPLAQGQKLPPGAREARLVFDQDG